MRVSTPHVPTSASRSAQGHCSERWKMLPPGQADALLEVDRALDLDARRCRRRRGRAPSSIGSAEHGVERAQGRLEGLAGRCLVVLAEEPRRQVQAEERQRLGVRRGQVRPEDGAVGQGVAVDLARRQVGDAPVARRGIRLLAAGRSPR